MSGTHDLRSGADNSGQLGVDNLGQFSKNNSNSDRGQQSGNVGGTQDIGDFGGRGSNQGSGSVGGRDGFDSGSGAGVGAGGYDLDQSSGAGNTERGTGTGTGGGYYGSGNTDNWDDNAEGATNINKASMGDRFKGGAEQFVGKMTKNADLQQQGKERKRGDFDDNNQSY